MQVAEQVAPHRYLSAVVAGVLVTLGVAAAVAPDIVISNSRFLVSPAGIYAAAALRCAMGVLLLVVVRGSRAPEILTIMGLALLIAGTTMPLLGVDNARTRIEGEASHAMFLRLEGLLFAWAGLIVYQLSGRLMITPEK
jgi:hypothetical protein